MFVYPARSMIGKPSIDASTDSLTDILIDTTISP